ncbi:MAG: ATP-binding cassette domain-containing protein [Woeseiaceae bacterium]|nr:ATP-binding cassette domain-containing protein [Woeseiaceae bacterium]
MFRMIIGQETARRRRRSISATRSSWPTSTSSRDSARRRARPSGRRSPTARTSSRVGNYEVHSRAYVGRFNFKGADQQKNVGDLSGGERNRVHLAKMLKAGGNVLLLDEPTNDLDVETLRALEEALLRLRRLRRGHLATTAGSLTASPRTSSPFEGDSQREWFRGQLSRRTRRTARARLGAEADQPHRHQVPPYRCLIRCDLSGDCSGSFLQRLAEVRPWGGLFRALRSTSCMLRMRIPAAYGPEKPSPGPHLRSCLRSSARHPRDQDQPGRRDDEPGRLAMSGVFTLFALLFLARTVRCTRRGRLLRAGGASISCIVAAVLATASILITIGYVSYDRLTAEQRISTIEFIATGPDEYRARLMRDDERDQLYVLRGDEWQIDARLIMWKPPVTLLGLDPVYRLERLSGRYAAVERERSEVRTVHELSPEQPLDLWRMARRFPFLLPGVDAYYGTATYVPMADGARYDISLSRDALIARPANAIALEAVGNWDGGEPRGGPDYVQPLEAHAVQPLY